MDAAALQHNRASMAVETLLAERGDHTSRQGLCRRVAQHSQRPLPVGRACETGQPAVVEEQLEELRLS